ncbi:ABC transporter permease [Nocardioides sp. zg-ZUI104]|uniref:ABC transporter permease n=1 Tax=Nocardioides faecalis TaxID=2803858 RepID=UPI001BD077C0|nr:ABC transporter permease [Nocardioides faecalis]MBS4754549.1 ABC transporter permease [Nocardioides faecalis]
MSNHGSSTAPAPAAGRRRRRSAGRPRTHSSVYVLGGLLGLVVLLAVAGPLLPLDDPNAQDLRGRLQAPTFWIGGTEHPLGTDQLGRDILSRLVEGARLTVLIAVLAVGLGGVVGTCAGMLAGYHGGWIDKVISRMVDAQLAVPFLLIAMSIISTNGRSLTALVIVLSIFVWARYARLVRADVLSLTARPFIPALRSSGLPTWRIMISHVLPNISGTVLVVTTLEIGMIIISESALSFLGLGVVAPDISWGAMLADGRASMQDAWWVVAFPGLAITLVVLSVNLLGDALRVQYDPRKQANR